LVSTPENIHIFCSKNNKAGPFQTSNIYLKIATSPMEVIPTLENHIGDNLSKYVKT